MAEPPVATARNAPSASSLPGVPQPRYRQLASTLIAEIESGAYPAGSLIPTEFELCEQFGASRFTVREAIKQLVGLGMVSRQAGVGTRVTGTRRQAGYRQVLESLSDLQRYTSETRLRIHQRKVMTVSGDLARQLGGRGGEAWLHLEALRTTGAGAPFALTSIYIHPAFRSLALASDVEHTPIYVLLERQFGERIAEVRQQIGGVAIGGRAAKLLGVRRGAAGLHVTRAYVNTRGEIVELALNTHPADRYSYSQTFRQETREYRD